MKRILVLAAPVLLISASFAQAQTTITLPQAQYYVSTWYQQFLKRLPDPGAAGWVLALVNGQPAGYILADILSSSEYFTRAGGTNAGFVSQLYQDQLGRAPTVVELIFWTNLLQRSSRRTIAYQFLVSQGNIALISPQQARRRHRH
ncbi:MAG TPA: DUF4214 domain-containing protein [Gemmataceae bacterium]|nr:DUF4214 domain-containing protein [Gemmataceae bacterium]